MHIENIDEPIDVIASFENDKQLQPHRFRWNGRVYYINKVNHVRHDRVKTAVHEIHFMVSVDSADAMELILKIEGAYLSWRIARVYLP